MCIASTVNHGELCELNKTKARASSDGQALSNLGK